MQFVLPDGFFAAKDEPLVIELRMADCTEPLLGSSPIAVPSDASGAFALRDDGLGPDALAGDGIYSADFIPRYRGPLAFSATAAPGGLTLVATLVGQVIEVPAYQRIDVPFDWIDPSLGAPLAVHGDDSAVSLPLPFTFPLYGLPRTSVVVSSNGYLTFGSDGTDFSNDPIPSPAQPNALIAPYWDDLDPSLGGEIRWLAQGSAPDRRFTVTWLDVPYFGGGTRASFQVTLYEADAGIAFRYLDIEGGDGGHDHGVSATVGVEDDSGSLGYAIPTGMGLLESGQAIELRIAPSTCVTGPHNDADSDGVCDVDDNCPYAWNPDQRDAGGVGQSHPDGTGDACQCGDVNRDGVVNGSDSTLIQRLALGQLPAAIADALDPAMCPVFMGDPDAGCSGMDAVVVRRAALGLSPPISPICAHALP
jgi:hypothetical protein